MMDNLYQDAGYEQLGRYRSVFAAVLETGPFHHDDPDTFRLHSTSGLGFPFTILGDSMTPYTINDYACKASGILRKEDKKEQRELIR